MVEVTNKAAELFIIEEHLWQSWHAFNNLSDQWRYQSFGLGGSIRVGLEAHSVFAYLKALNDPCPIASFEKIRNITKGVLIADQEKRGMHHDKS